MHSKVFCRFPLPISKSGIQMVFHVVEVETPTPDIAEIQPQPAKSSVRYGTTAYTAMI